METVSAATIQDMIATGRIVEAKTLLTMGTPSLSAEDLHVCTLAIEQRLAQAAALIDRAEAMERTGKTEEAQALYQSVLDVAIDFPGIREHLKRVNEALALTQAVQRRGRRVRQSVPPEKGSTKKRTVLLFGAILAAALVVAAFFLTPDKPQPPTALPKKPVLAPVPQPASPPAPPLPATTPLPESISQGETRPPEPTLTEDPHPVTGPDASTHPAPTVPPLTEPLPSPPQPLAPPEIPATPQPVAETPAAPTDFYTVHPGDSLSLIAERRFCQSGLWHKLYQLNRDRIVDPQKLQPGMVLRLNGMESRCPAAP